MRRETPAPRPAPAAEARVRRGYFECRCGQLHVHYSIPPGGGFEEATALLCVHDLPGSGRVFARFLALAGLDRSVYAPDLPGFGESDPPTPAAAITDYSEALGDFLDSMRLRHLDVLGQRAGALVATELALARPAQIRRVVLVSPPLLSESERPQRGAARGRALRRCAAAAGLAAPGVARCGAVRAARAARPRDPESPGAAAAR